MTRLHARPSRTLSRVRWTPYLMVVASVCLAMLSPGLSAHAAGPAVPVELEVPPGHTLFLRARAFGTQNYICLPTDSGFGWAFFGPQATLFTSGSRGQIITHFLSPNPDEEDLPRATWQHSRDTSRVWANAVASSSDPRFVRRGAIPWLLLEVVGAEPGPTGGTRLTETVYIQRIRTSGGVAPATGCDDQDPDVGARALVPYRSDYLFYRPIFMEEPPGDDGGLPFTCSGKLYCREMTSCAEARFHLTQCGLTRLDGDDDGVPCESLCR